MGDHLGVIKGMLLEYFKDADPYRIDILRDYCKENADKEGPVKLIEFLISRYRIMTNIDGGDYWIEKYDAVTNKWFCLSDTILPRKQLREE